jgi:hypothetical protein
MIVIMILSMALIMIAPMVLVTIVVFRVALILPVLVMLILVVLVLVIIAFSCEGGYGKHQSACYRANEREFANHLFFLCYWWRLGLSERARLEADALPFLNLRTIQFDPKPAFYRCLKLLPRLGLAV